MTATVSSDAPRGGLTLQPDDHVRLRCLVAESFAGYAGGSAHPCLGALSTVHRDAYTVAVHGRLGSREAAATLADELSNFGRRATDDRVPMSYVAVFTEPSSMDEATFDDLLWRQLQLVHDRDRRGHDWDPRVSADPENPHFSFSVGGRAYFVIGLQAGSSRWARRFAWPTLVFNPHAQFIRLREQGRFERMRDLIRERDRDLQGGANPAVCDHGETSEARQYAGSTATAWKCPLQVRP